MKKSKVLAAFVAATVLAVGGGVLAGCNNGHTHTYSDKYSHDASGHWYAATCDDLKEGDEGYKKDYATHVWGDDDTCDVCGYEREPSQQPAPVTISETELKLGIGNTEAELTAQVAGGGTVTWSSDNESVVAVNEETGYVEALKPGTATITATVVGGTDTATCDVVVEDAYYIIGGQDADWNKCGVFGDSNVIYFMPTETEGIYKTKSFELAKLGNFQVAPVGDTSGDWWKKAFNGDYIATGDEVLSKNEGGNIAVGKHGKYTVTLDLTGDTAVISGVCDEEIDDSNVKEVYYIIGLDEEKWTPAATEENVIAGRAFTDNEDGTYSITIDLQKDWEFKVALVGMGYNGALGESAVASEKIGQNGTATKYTDYQLTWTNSDNICVGVSGKYTITINPTATGRNRLTYTFEVTDATEEAEEPKQEIARHYYIKGNQVTGWANKITSEYELKETTAGSGVYTLTIELAAADDFMFYAYAEFDDGIKEEQVAYFNGGNTTLNGDADGNITATTNYKTGAAGWYTITLNPTEKTISFSYSATNPATPAE